MRLTELSEDARRLLADAEQGGGLLLEDEGGQTRRVYVYREPTNTEREEALEKLRVLQKNAYASMNEHGKTEDDLMREILKDDGR